MCCAEQKVRGAGPGWELVLGGDTCTHTSHLHALIINPACASTFIELICVCFFGGSSFYLAPSTSPTFCLHLTLTHTHWPGILEMGSSMVMKWGSEAGDGSPCGLSDSFDRSCELM